MVEPLTPEFADKSSQKEDNGDLAKIDASQAKCLNLFSLSEEEVKRIHCITNSDSLNSRKETCKSSDSKPDFKNEPKSKNQFDYYNIPENEDSVTEEDGESVSCESGVLRDIDLDQINAKQSFGSTPSQKQENEKGEQTPNFIQEKANPVGHDGEKSYFNNFKFPVRSESWLKRKKDVDSSQANSSTSSNLTPL